MNALTVGTKFKSTTARALKNGEVHTVVTVNEVVSVSNCIEFKVVEVLQDTNNPNKTAVKVGDKGMCMATFFAKLVAEGKYEI